MKKIIAVLMTLIMGVFVFGCSMPANESQSASSASNEIISGQDSPVEGMKVAYALNMAESDIFEDCADACVATAKQLGMSCDVFYSDGDDEAFQDYIMDCAKNGYDGVFLSHGGEDYSYEFINEVLSAHPDFKIVTFDTNFIDENGSVAKIDGVTQIFQDDADLANASLNYICTAIAPDAQPVRVLKVWVPDYLAAFDRRDLGYQPFEDSGQIETVATIGPEDLTNGVASMEEVMKDVLSQYDASEIDAIWVAYDAYAQGCYNAMNELGVSIPMVSVDLSDQDIACMVDENSPWKACAYTDFTRNGEQGMRVLALELAGDYEFITDPETGAATDYMEIPASLISAEEIQKHDIHSLEDIRNNEPASPSWLVTCDWLKDCFV